MTALAVPRGNPTPAKAPRPVVSLDDVLLELIDIGDNVRDDVGDLDELAASIAELGVLDPVKVTRQDDGRYRLVFGQRRVLASVKAGQLRIPAIIEPASDIDAKSARRSIEQLSENLQRKDLNPIEEAVALREVLDGNPGLTQVDLARRLGRSASWLAHTLRLQALDPAVQALIRSEAISASHGKAIANLPEFQQRALAARVVERKMSSHDLEREITWKQTEATQAAAKVAKTERAIPKAITALVKAETPKSTTLLVHGSTWDLDLGAVVSAIKKAGWKEAVSKYSHGGRPKGCDCTALRVEVTGRAPKLEPTCSDETHAAAGRADDWKAREGALAALEAKLEELQALVRRDLDIARSRSPILALVEWALGNTWGRKWSDQVTRADDDLLDAIAGLLVPMHRMREVDVDGLIATLRASQGEGNAGSGPSKLPPVPKPAKGKKAAAS